MGMFKGSYKKAAAAGLAALVLTGLMAGCGMSSGGDKKAGGAAGQKVELKLAYQFLPIIICPRASKSSPRRSMNVPKVPLTSKSTRQASFTMIRT